MMGNVLSDVKQTVMEKNDADELLKVKQYLRKWGRVQQICGCLLYTSDAADE